MPMTMDLTTRLLAEIERRETANRADTGTGDVVRATQIVGYLAALRKVVELHRYEPFADDPERGFCSHDQRTAGVWPCADIVIIAEALGVEP